MALKHFTDEDFNENVSKGVTLVDFYADWCGPCKMITPIVEELAVELADQATVAKVDVDNAQQTATQLGVTSIPTIILFKEGQEVERVVGLKDKDSLKKMIQAAL